MPPDGGGGARGGSWKGGYTIVIEGTMVHDLWQHRHITSMLLPNKAVHRMRVNAAKIGDYNHLYRVAGIYKHLGRV